MGLDSEIDARSSLLAEHLQDRVVGRPEDLDPGRGIEGFGVRVGCAVADQVHVELHRLGVGMNLDHADLGLAPEGETTD